MKRNEARVKLNLPPDSDPEADKLTVQAQMVPLVTIGQTKPEPAPAPKSAAQPDTETPQE